MRAHAVSVAVGIVLSAGAGTRFGGPKALARTADGTPWPDRAVDLLRQAGCERVFVTMGAAVVTVPGAEIVTVPDWRRGVSAAVRAGLAAAHRTAASLALLTLVDLPAMPVSVVERVREAGAGQSGLARAVFEGKPGHPVALGRAHWGPVAASVTGDSGAGAYLRAHSATLVECSDVWDGRDVDHLPAC